MKKMKVKEVIIFLLKCVIVYIVTDALGTGLRVLTGILEGQHGAPSFLTPAFTTYSYVMKVLRVTAFLLLGNTIPVKGKIKKGLIFALLLWGSSYMPQVLGMQGGHSAIIAEGSMSIGTICADSLGYLLKGFAWGFIFGKTEALQKRECDRKSYITACIVSMIVFPIALIGCELLAGQINSQMYCINAFTIDSNDNVSFYIIFYLFQVVSGALFPVVYRMTGYNKKQNWMIFGSIYAWIIWLPVVLIMALFGVGIVETVVWGFMMVAAIYLDVFLFIGIMNKSRN